MENQNKIIFQKERKTNEILRDAFNFVKSNYKDVFAKSFKIIAPFFALALISSFYNSYYLHHNIIGVNNFFSYLIIYSLQQFIIVLFITIVQASILNYVKYYVNGDRENQNNLKTIVYKRFYSLLGLNISVVLISFFATLFFIIPGIYIYIVLLLSPAILLYQDLSISDTISESFRFIKNKWWDVFGTFFLLVLLIVLSSLSFQLISYLYLSFKSLFYESNSMDIPSSFNDLILFLIYIISFSFYLLLYIYIVVVYAMMYYNIIEKEGHSALYKEVDKIGMNIEK